MDMKKKLPPLHNRVEKISTSFSDERRASEKCVVIHVVSRSGIDILVTPSITKVISNIEHAWGNVSFRICQYPFSLNLLFD